MLTAISIIIGGMVGSFLNVCICRLPKGESIVTPRSHCPHCQTLIRFYDNIPLLSYLLLRGKCRYCHKSISIQYPVVEGVTALGSLILFLKFGMSWEYLLYFAFLSALITITVIDLYHQIIPNEISLPGIGVGLLVALFFPQITTLEKSINSLPNILAIMLNTVSTIASVRIVNPHLVGFINSLLGMLLGGGSLWLVAILYSKYYEIVRKKKGMEGMGFGDVKLLAMIGAFLGWKAVVLTILSGSLFGSIIGMIVIVIKGKDLKYAIPFGPFLSLGAVLSLFWGEAIIRWYLYLNR